MSPRWRASARARRSGISIGLVGVVVVGVLASIHPGVTAAEVRFNDGGVWVTNNQLRLVARLNYPSRTLDGGLRAPSERFDVTQEATQVLLHDDVADAAMPVDVALFTAAPPTAVPGAQVTQGGGRLAITDPGAGTVWGLPFGDLGGFDRAGAKPLLTGFKGAKTVVDVEGGIHVLAADGRLATIATKGEGWDEPSIDKLPGSAPGDDAQITAVGTDAVVLDRAGGAVIVGGDRVDLPEAGTAVLQQPSAAADEVTLATASGLDIVDLDGGDVRQVDAGGTGTPAAPVYLAGCRYGAWSGSGVYVRDCADGHHARVAVDKLRTKPSLVFRVNRDVVVLNDTDNGDVFVAEDNLRLVNNWEDISAQVKALEKQDDRKDTTEEKAPPQRSEVNQKPDAVDDTFGVRPGRASLLPVRSNDTDPDGDVLTVTATSKPKLGTLRSVRAGAALELDVPGDAKGSTSFTYRADDGRGGTDDATVSVTVRPWTSNEPPHQDRTTSSVDLVSGGTADYDVSSDWSDPDGDPLQLVDVKAPEGMSAKFRADGLVTLRDLGTAPAGRKKITITMSDGRRSTNGLLFANVRSPGPMPPVANADHVQVITGHQVTVYPLRNDTDPNGDKLRLAKVQKAPPGAKVVPDFSDGSFVFTATSAGPVYLEYVVTDGPSTATGVVRIDVLAPAAEAAPEADPDVALLPAGGDVTIDPLANDFDPGGGVLVVQSVDVAPDAGITVEIVQRAQLRISAPSGLAGERTFTYTVSNGKASAKGTVTVIPLPPVPTSVPPVAEDDEAVVRAGDVVTVRVLDNDESPSNLRMSIDPTITAEGAPLGEAFVSQDTVRFKAGDRAGTARLIYTVRDTQQGFDSAEITITVRGREGDNAPPRPLELTQRVLAGSSVRIPVQLDGIDPDGDSVTLLGLDTPPTRGTALVGPTWLEYRAPAGANGTDTFTYVVMDAFGARGIGTVRVGIAPPNPINQSPVAVADTVVVRPSRKLAVAVLANDLDPDGDRVQLVEGGAKGIGAGADLDISTLGSRVALTSPSTPGIYPVEYRIEDGRGGTATGQLTVDVRLETPLQAPVARDDIVLGSDTAGKSEVVVDVLANDEDPDGAASALKVSTEAAGVSVGDGGKLTIPVLPARQVLVYTVTDVDGLTGRAAVVVPGSADRLPMLVPAKVPAQIKGGETLTIPLGEYVSVRDGHQARLTFENRVHAGVGGDGSPLVKNSTTLAFTPKGEFSGLTAVTFEVTDGETADDPKGLKAVLTLPVQVLPSGRTRPVFTPSLVQVAPAEPAQEVDLAKMVTDPDPGDLDKLTFSVGGAPTGFDVSLDGHLLKVSTPDGTKEGTVGLLDVTVTDGSTTPVQGKLPLRTIASTRPLMSVTDAVINDANAGRAEKVDLNQYVTNPFAAEGKPIVLVGSPRMRSGQGTVTGSGTTIEVTPAADFHGQLTAEYTVGDATHDHKREVRGRVLLTVRAAPDAPQAVVAETKESRTAVVSWTAGANNGAQISDFAVSWSGGSKHCGAVTTCTISGLTNNVKYRFTVVATNEVGDSVPSQPSNEVRPDVKPDQPAPPTLTFGDKQIEVRWAKPATEGSPVKGYTLEVDGPTGGANQKIINGAGVTSLTWAGLTNGASYRFRVQAFSDASEPSEFSAYSSPEIPAGVPQGLTAPKVEKAAASALEPSAKVTWDAPDGNGDDEMTYELRRVGGATVYTGTSPSVQLTLDVSTSDQTFEYRATNKAGASQWSPASTAVRGFKAPGSVTGLDVSATGKDNQVSIRFGAAAPNGARSDEIEYVWQGGGGEGTLPAGGGTVTDGALGNGTAVSISVFARSTVDGDSVAGPKSTAGAVTPYGPPRAPAVSASGGANSVTLSWDAGGSGNGRRITAVRIETSDGGQQVVGISGSVQQGNGRNQTKFIKAQAQDETGQWGDWSGGTSASTWADPDWSFTDGGAAPTSSCKWNADPCRYVNLSLTRFNPNSSVQCEVGGWNAPSWSATFGVDGNGNAAITPVSGLRAGSGVTWGRGFGACRQL